MDKIIIKNACLECNIGVPSEERDTKQSLFVDITIKCSLHAAGLSDDINSTINYASVHKQLKAACETPVSTLEGLAARMATRLRENFNFDSVIIQIRKPGAMRHKNVEYAAVEIER